MRLVRLAPVAFAILLVPACSGGGTQAEGGGTQAEGGGTPPSGPTAKAPGPPVRRRPPAPAGSSTALSRSP